jgi:hypothetical protein
MDDRIKPEEIDTPELDEELSDEALDRVTGLATICIDCGRGL